VEITSRKPQAHNWFLFASVALNGPIIIVDDDEDEIMLVKSALASIHVPNVLITFGNGKEALAYLEETKDNPFIILSDMSMPVMDGLELKSEITARPHLVKKSIPFVFRSGSVTNDIIQQAYELNVQGFFPKTMSFDELKQQLELIINYWKNCYEPSSVL